jgi:hypothetical protein
LQWELRVRFKPEIACPAPIGLETLHT